MNDIDVSGKMKREDFEKLSESMLARVRKTLQELMVEAKLQPQDVDLVEIVGGSTRIPAVKQIVHEVFGKEASTTLNADEACARGCTLMCAILSPTFKVKEFKIEDCQLFPITLNWKGAETDDNELEVYPRFEKIPLSKLLTIYKREPFEIEARYRFPNNIPYNDARIGKFYIANVTPNAQGENSEVKLKARITKNGIFEISTPQLIETVEVAPPTPTSPQQQPASGAENGESQANKPGENAADSQQSQTVEENNGEETMENEEQAQQQNADGTPAGQQANQQQQNVKKRKTKAVDLPLTAKVPQLTKTEINFFVEQELSMIQQDRKEKERSEAKNSVEEYIYDIRDKLSNEYDRFVSEDNKSTFLRLLDETESWLYSEEAENQEKSIYVERLQRLKNHGEPLRKRFKESQDRPQAFEDLGKSLQLIKKALNLFYQNDDKYNHLDKNDIDRIAKTVEEKQKWFEEKSYLVNKQKPTDDPVVLVTQIKDEKDSLDKQAWSVLNRPKPKVEPPKPKEQPNEQPQPQPQPNGQSAPQDPNQKPNEASMETD